MSRLTYASNTAGSSLSTPVEREYIRTQLSIFLSTLPTAAEGVPLKTWNDGMTDGTRSTSNERLLDASEA